MNDRYAVSIGDIIGGARVIVECRTPKRRYYLMECSCGTQFEMSRGNLTTRIRLNRPVRCPDCGKKYHKAQSRDWNYRGSIGAGWME